MFELKTFHESDFQKLIGWIDSPELLVQWGGPNFSFPLDELQLKKHLSEVSQCEPKKLIFAARSIDTLETIGHIELNRIDYESRTAAICRVFIDPKSRNLGLGSNMVQSLLEIAFNKLNLNEVSLNVYHFNRHAIALYKKLGFRQVDIKTNSYQINNESWDTLCFVICKTRYQEVTQSTQAKHLDKV